MKKRTLGGISLALLILPGCINLLEQDRSASSATPELKVSRNATVPSPTWHGAPPGEGYEAQIRLAMGSLMQDPESACFKFEEPEQGSVACNLFDEDVAKPHCQGECLFGWTVSFYVGTRNRKAGCSGEQPFEAFFHEGELRGILRECKQKDSTGAPTWALLVSLPMGK